MMTQKERERDRTGYNEKGKTAVAAAEDDKEHLPKYKMFAKTKIEYTSRKRRKRSNGLTARCTVKHVRRRKKKEERIF